MTDRTSKGRLTDNDLRILIETFCFQKESALSNHQRHLLLALQELSNRRAFETNGFSPVRVESGEQVKDCLICGRTVVASFGESPVKTGAEP